MTLKWQIHRLEEVDSTNRYIRDRSKNTLLPEGTVVIARKQTDGRGQRGTRWISEQGSNLTFSFLLRPANIPVERQFLISQSVALAVKKFIDMELDNKYRAPLKTKKFEADESEKAQLTIVNEHFEGEVQRRNLKFLEVPYPVFIKWPNDVYAGDRKIAGMLIESSISGLRLESVIAGVGININQEKFDPSILNPVSLRMLTGKNYPVEELLETFLEILSGELSEIYSGKFDGVELKYASSQYKLNIPSDFFLLHKKIRATITGIDLKGRLMLQTDDGKELAVDQKEIIYC